MDFLDSLQKYWTIIVFIGGSIFTVGFSKAQNESTKKQLEEKNLQNQRELDKLDIRVQAVDKGLDLIKLNHTDIKGDIKAIKEMLNLLINDKIKR